MATLPITVAVNTLRAIEDAVRTDSMRSGGFAGAPLTPAEFAQRVNAAVQLFTAQQIVNALSTIEDQLYKE